MCYYWTWNWPWLICISLCWPSLSTPAALQPAAPHKRISRNSSAINLTSALNISALSKHLKLIQNNLNLKPLQHQRQELKTNTRYFDYDFYGDFSHESEEVLSSSRQVYNHREKRQSVDYNLEGYTKSCHATLEIFPQKIIRVISPFHGRKQYPSSLKCQWEIIGQETCKPVVICDDIDLRKTGSNDECDTDDLTISDGMLSEKQFCGSNQGFINPMKGIKGTYLYISFTSSADSTYFDRLYKGFYCHVHCHNSLAIPETQQPLPPSDPPKEAFKCLCGRKFNDGNNRIVNGENAKKDEFPFQAAIVHAGTRKPICGGSLINGKFILTAAHCLLDDSGNVIDVSIIGILLRGYILEQGMAGNGADVALGEENSIRSPGWDLKNDPEHSKDDLIIHIDEIIIHQFYNKYVAHDCDIALLRLKRSLPLGNKDIPIPVCIPSADDMEKDYKGLIATVTGWGKAHEKAGGSTRILQKLDVPVLEDQQCREMYGEGDMEITENMLCAGYIEGGKDACSGDSGGPLTIQDGLRTVQIGVVSFGAGCARERRPGVYTRITKFLPWIRQHTKGAIWPRQNENP